MSYSVIIDDNFTRANTTAGSAANSTNVTAPGTFNSPSTGAPYVDVEGNRWEILSNTLTGPSTWNAGDFSSGYLLRPSSESVLNGQSAVTFLPNAYGYGGATVLAARVQSGGTGAAYGCYVYSSTSGNTGWVLALAKLGPGNNTQTVLTSGSPALAGSTPYIMTLTVNGTSPTTLTATIAAAATPGTIIQTITTTDSTGALQVSGQWGIAANAYGGTASNNQPVGTSITRFTTYTAGTGTSLTIGTLTAISTATGISLALSAALSGGLGSGYQYQIYRGTDPNFTANSSSLLTTVSTMPYTDTSAGAGVQYYYGIVGLDGAGATVNCLPGGLGSYAPTYLAYVTGQLQTQDLNIVFVGDSITYGAGVSNSGTVNSPTMPYFCITKLKRLLGIRTINASNKGVSGYTFTDWAPAGSTYAGAKSAMTTLMTADSTALPVFSIMLGTNDSAQSGTNNAGSSSPVTTAQIQTLAKNLINQMLTDFPTCKVFLHLAPYYTPSTHNTSNYEQAGLSALSSYRAALMAVVSSYSTTKPGQVYLGDTYSFQYFAQNGQQGEQQAESGANGTFYLHPAGTAGSNGLIGTQSLGEMHAQAIAQGLYGVATTTSGRSFSFS